jgi:hypothetical protein
VRVAAISWWHQVKIVAYSMMLTAVILHHLTWMPVLQCGGLQLLLEELVALASGNCRRSAACECRYRVACACL